MASILAGPGEEKTINTTTMAVLVFLQKITDSE